VRFLREGLDVEGYFDRLRSADESLLLLDYDGTMAPFRDERHEAAPYPGVREVLDRIRQAGGDPVIISGRPAEEVAGLLDLEPHPEIWGCHGWERRTPGGHLERMDPGPEAVEGLRNARDQLTGWVPEERLEHKGAAVAVHFRGLAPDEAARLQDRISTRWGELVADTASLELRPFDGGLEVRAGARDKGSAVRELLERIPEGAPVAYLGDDRTDEDAFEAVRRVGGLAVLVRSELRPTAADVWLRPPEEMLGFLERWARTLTERKPRPSPGP